MENFNEKNNLSNIYNDFFGINVLSKNADILNTEITNLNTEKKILTEDEKKNKITELYEKIDNVYLDEQSKTLLKKIVDYSKKYNEGIVKNYIPFNMRIYCDNDKTLTSILDILVDAFNFFGYMKNCKYVFNSFYNIDNQNSLSDIYSNNGLIVIKNINGLINQDSNVQEKILNTLENKIYESNNNTITIIVDKNKDKINEAFSNNSSLKEKIFDFELTTITPEPQDVYRELLDKIKKDYKTTEKFDINILDYISATFSKTNLSYPEYIDSLYEKIIFNNTEDVISEASIPSYDKTKNIDEIFEELNELVGLNEVKEVLNNLVDLINFKNKVGDKVKVKDTNLHMVFLGNPGTGKTTVARMVAGILYNLNYISQNKLIEVSAKDLVAKYVGQTAPQTMSVVEKALGGVLFIDEAYSLASTPGEDNSFNAECVATLIQAMENYRDNLVVIFAGYTKEMQYFLNSNSGIVSRIGYTINFADYTEDELISIFKSMTKKAGFSVTDKAIEKIRNIISEYKDTKNFGNARFIRNLYEKAVIKHAANSKNKTSLKSLRTIDETDISTDNLLKM